MSAVTCVVYFVPLVMRAAGIVAVAWNFLLFILWICLFGVFGAVCYKRHRSPPFAVTARQNPPQAADFRLQLFIHENPEGDSGIKRMKNAVWVDLVSALLWLSLTIASGLYWWRHRDTRSQFTGRARV